MATDDSRSKAVDIDHSPTQDTVAELIQSVKRDFEAHLKDFNEKIKEEMDARLSELVEKCDHRERHLSSLSYSSVSSQEVNVGKHSHGDTTGHRDLHTKIITHETPGGAVDILKEFSESTTLHGFAHVVRLRSRFNTWRWKNFLFLLVTMTCLGFAGVNVVTMVTDYFTYPVVTTSYTETENPMIFPAVTICNNNKEPNISYDINNRDSYEDPVYLLHEQHGHADYLLWDEDNCRQESINQKDNFTTESRYPCVPRLNPDVTGHELDLYFRGHLITDTCYLDGEHCQKFGATGLLDSCTFGGVPCSESDFYWTYDQVYGNCYTFNSHMGMHGASEVRSVNKADKESGLTMILGLASDKYGHDFQDIGLRVLVHSNKERPFPEDNSIIISPGSHTFVEFEKTRSVDLPPPYGTCDEDFTEEDHQEKSFFADQYDFSESACLKTCLQIHAMLFCDCCLENYPCKPLPEHINSSYAAKPFNKLWPCSPEDAENCNRHSEGKSFLSECQSECRPPCTKDTFGLTLSAAKWPPQNPLYWAFLMEPIGNYLASIETKNESEQFYLSETNHYAIRLRSRGRHCNAENYAANYWSHYEKCSDYNNEITNTLIEATSHFNYMKYTTDHVKVSVYPKSLEVKTVVTSPKYDWVAFLSMIGGVMGLFTGFSVLSCLEIVELIFDLLGNILTALGNIFHQRHSIFPHNVD